MPLDAPGVTVERALTVYGYDDAPHGHMEIELKDVRIPASAMLLGEGRGFEIAQGRLGPGRIHHCMRTIGVAEEALKAMVKRLQTRIAFGKRLMEHSVWEQRVAAARIDIDMSRLLCLKAADMMDKAGNKAAAAEIAMIKVYAPNMALRIIDDAVQAHGGAGVSQDFELAKAGPESGPCGSPTAPTRSTTGPSPGSSSPSMRCERVNCLLCRKRWGGGPCRSMVKGWAGLRWCARTSALPSTALRAVPLPVSEGEARMKAAILRQPGTPLTIEQAASTPPRPARGRPAAQKARAGAPMASAPDVRRRSRLEIFMVLLL